MGFESLSQERLFEMREAIADRICTIAEVVLNGTDEQLDELYRKILMDSSTDDGTTLEKEGACIYASPVYFDITTPLDKLMTGGQHFKSSDPFLNLVARVLESMNSVSGFAGTYTDISIPQVSSDVEEYIIRNFSLAELVKFQRLFLCILCEEFAHGFQHTLYADSAVPLNRNQTDGMAYTSRTLKELGFPDVSPIRRKAIEIDVAFLLAEILAVRGLEGALTVGDWVKYHSVAYTNPMEFAERKGIQVEPEIARCLKY